MWKCEMGPMAILLLLAATAAVLLTLVRHRLRSLQVVAAGFFHPYTNDGGGGERVLWCAVRVIQELVPGIEVVVYTGDKTSPELLAARAMDRFGVQLLRPPKVVSLHKRKWVDARTYPRFTMIGQSLGSIYLAMEALCKFNPKYFLDTSGYAFSYPVARFFGCKVICYTHYPTISADMLSRVKKRTSIYNNNDLIAKSALLSSFKLMYYNIFGWLYGLVGSCTDVAVVNSSWTRSHINHLWKIPEQTKRVFPPCDTSALQALPLQRTSTTPVIISVAQFRPEKAHALQLEAFAVAVKQLDPNLTMPKLQFVGSCRNQEDIDRLQKLKARTSELEMDEYVEFHRDISYRGLVHLLGGAVAGLHSMIDEHFGISVVEYMAAGAIPIAHNSAGPMMDIVLPEDGQQTGFLASTEEEYANAIVKVLQMSESERMTIAAAARRRAQRFSEDRFKEDFKDAVLPILTLSE